MKNVVTDDPQSNVEVMLNLAYVKDKEVWIRGGGADGEDCSLVNFTKQMCQNCSMCMENDGFPEDKEQDLDFLCDLFMECSMCGCPIGTAYFIAIQAAELRERLRQYENEAKPMIEDERGWNCPACGIRLIGKTASGYPCDLIDLPLNFCPRCGQEVKFDA